MTEEQMAAMTEGEAVELFYRMRWPDGAPACPRCSASEPYRHKRRVHLYVCRQCARQFTPTSGAVFLGRKLPYLELMRVLYKILTPRGASLLKLSRESGYQYRTIYSLAQKLRAAP